MRTTTCSKRQRWLMLFLFGLLVCISVSPTVLVAAQSRPSTVSEIIRAKLQARKPPPPVFAVPIEEIRWSPVVGINLSDSISTQLAASRVPFREAPPSTEKSAKFIPPKLYADKVQLRAATMLTRFYEMRAYQPAWTTPHGPLPSGEQFLQLLQEEAPREGLRASDYHLAKLQALLAKTHEQQALPPEFLTDLELLFTDAFLRYGVAVSLGSVPLDSLDAEWFITMKKPDLVTLLQQAIDTTQLERAFRNLPPQHPGYRKLREALAHYRDIAARGGWPMIPGGPALSLGAHGDRVARVRSRLTTSTDLRPDFRAETTNLFDPPEPQPVGIPPSSLFDEGLEQAVRRFQQRHGLQETGVVNAKTLAALNVSADMRARQIAMNMQRWRKLPGDLGQRHIMVNVPDFTLEVVDQQQPQMTMKVVVGKVMEERSTPSFSANMKYLVLNPYWYVPKTIAEKELLPLSKKNPQYLAKNNFSFHRVPAGFKQVPDPNATDGSTISVRAYDYILRQGPGPKNSLGRVKFMFPNPYNVYLHDTPSKHLFDREVRAFSHGCIRVEKPIELAEYLLRTDPKWDKKAILSTLKRKKERTVWLPDPLPVHIQYWTAWVDQNGTIQFRPDIYQRDNLEKSNRSKGKKKVSSRRPRKKDGHQPPATRPVTEPVTAPAVQAAN
ncbi:MAG: murein L,D-transpeptidase [Candidatus Binatia bacterium]